MTAPSESGCRMPAVQYGCRSRPSLPAGRSRMRWSSRASAPCPFLGVDGVGRAEFLDEPRQQPQTAVDLDLGIVVVVEHAGVGGQKLLRLDVLRRAELDRGRRTERDGRLVRVDHGETSVSQPLSEPVEMSGSPAGMPVRALTSSVIVPMTVRTARGRTAFRSARRRSSA